MNMENKFTVKGLQGEFVLLTNFNIVREVTWHLDISSIILYNRFHSEQRGNDRFWTSMKCACVR